MSTETGVMKLDYDNAKLIKTLRATIAVGLSDEEFAIFVEYCKSTGLNPIKREVWAIKGKSYTNKRGERIEGKLQIMTGINGFYSIANDNEAYDGLECGLIDPEGNYKTAAYPKNDYIGAWCKVYRKDRKFPEEAVAFLEEYDQTKDPYYPEKGKWHAGKRGMIIKCAQSLGLRKALPQKLNGLYTEEEMPLQFAATPELNITPKKEELPPPARATTIATAEAAQPHIDEPADGQWKYTAKNVKPEKLDDFIRFMGVHGAVADPMREIWRSSKRIAGCDKYLAKPEDIKQTLHDTDYPDFDPPGAPLPPLKEKVSKKTKQQTEETSAHEN